MSQMEIRVHVPNAVTIESAKERMGQLLPRLTDQFKNEVELTELNTDWANYLATFSFKAKGYGINGTMTVGHNDVVISVTLPWIVNTMYGGKIRDAITNTANELMT